MSVSLFFPEVGVTSEPSSSFLRLCLLLFFLTMVNYNIKRRCQIDRVEMNEIRVKYTFLARYKGGCWKRLSYHAVVRGEV